MIKLLETLKDSAESTFDSATLRVENIHRMIGDYARQHVPGRRRRGPENPADEFAGEPTDAGGHRRRGATVYDVIRGVNRELGEFGTDVFQIIDDARKRRAAEKKRREQDDD